MSRVFSKIFEHLDFLQTGLQPKITSKALNSVKGNKSFLYLANSGDDSRDGIVDFVALGESI